jgi:hypothetical protein
MLVVAAVLWSNVLSVLAFVAAKEQCSLLGALKAMPSCFSENVVKAWLVEFKMLYANCRLIKLSDNIGYCFSAATKANTQCSFSGWAKITKTQED